MIKDITVIKKHLKGCSEVDINYPFKNGCIVKYITLKNDEESFFLGGKFIRMRNGSILLENGGRQWSVPLRMVDNQGDTIYESRFFIENESENLSCEKDKQELEKIIKTQQHIINKMTEKIEELHIRLSQR
jgi:hypothetical protein